MPGHFGFLLLKPDRPDLSEALAKFKHLMELIGGQLPPTAPPTTPPQHGSGHMETKLEDGRIWTPYGLTPPVLNAAIQLYWPIEVWTDASRVSHEESGWKFDAEMNTLARGGGKCGVRYWFSDEVGWATTEQSVGYFQINVCAHGGTREYWHDAENNARKGAELYLYGGWTPWQVTARRLGLIAR